MIITKIQPGPYVKWNLEGTKLIVEDIEIDLEEEQKDSQVIIDICGENGELIVGLGNMYVASIIIPPAKYELVEIDELDENGNPIYSMNKIPLDLESVELVLWQYQKQEEEVV
jgi:hypothetical protein